MTKCSIVECAVLRPSHSELDQDCADGGHKNAKLLANIKCLLGKKNLSIVYRIWPFNIFLITSPQHYNMLRLCY